MAVTSGIVRVRLNIPEVTLKRKVWAFSRDGAAIAPDPVKGAPASERVVMLPGGGWSLAPFSGGRASLLTTSYADAEIVPESLNLAPGVVSESMFHKSDLPGMVIGEDTRETALRAFRKTVAADQDWNAQVETASAEALPSPRIESPTGVPMDRLLAGKDSCDPNTGFVLTLGGISDAVDKGPICTLLFGGNAPVRPVFGKAESTGGQFALTFRQDGSAVLHERDELNGAEDPADFWEPRGSLQWGDANASETRFVSFVIVPYGRDRVALLGMKSPAVIGPSPRVGALPSAFVMGLPAANRSITPGCVIERASDSLHTHLETMTGSGPVYLDSRQDQRCLYSLSRVMYPESGVLVDAPFEVDGPTGPGHPMRVDLDTFILPNGGGCSVTAHDATTHEALATDDAGRFVTVAGQNCYYLKIAFTSSEDRFHAPILWGWSARIDGQFQARNPTPTVGGNLRSVGIQGPSRDCTTENAGVEFADPANQLGALLQFHDRFRADIVVVNPNTEAVVSRLFEGVVAEPEFDFRSSAQTARAAWCDYPQLRMIGMASRLGEQVPLGKALNFGRDESLPPEAHQPDVIPWRVADVLRLLLNDCGVPDDEIDIPAYYATLRLWSSGSRNFELHQLHPGGDQSYLRFIKRVCEDYLGATFLRDPNAGSRGMWRLLQPATVNSPVRAEFLRDRTGPAGVRGPVAFGPGQTFWQRGTFRQRIRAPEFNYLKVVGGADAHASGKATKKVVAEGYNYVSHEFYDGQPIAANSNHPDYLGRTIPHYFLSPALTTQQAVDWVWKRKYARGAHAEKEVQFRAPLLLITAPDDPYQSLPRPLRIQDLVRIQGPSGAYHLAVIKSCNPSWTMSDGLRMANYEAFYLT